MEEKKKLSPKLYCLVFLGLGTLLTGWGIWCLHQLPEMQSGSALDTRFADFGILSLLELFRWGMSGLIYYFWMLMGIVCTWNGILLVFNSILTMIVFRIRTVKAFGIAEKINYIWFVPVFIRMILFAVREYRGTVPGMIKTIILFWIGSCFLNLAALAFMKLFRQERKNLQSQKGASA